MSAAKHGGGFAWRWKGRLAAAGLLSIIALLWSWQAWRARELDLQEGEELVTALARSLEYQVQGSLRSIEALLTEVAERIDPDAWPDPALQDRFRARLAGFPEIRNLVVVDAFGQVIDTTLARPEQVMTRGSGLVGDREYFQRLRDGFPRQSLVIGVPVVSRFSGLPSIPVARAITGRDGSFAGAVLAGVDPATFRDKLASVTLEEEGGAALFLDGTTFLARVPRHDDYLGRTFPDTFLTRRLAATPSGVGRFVSPADGHQKVIAWRSVERFPLAVTVGLTTRTVLERWRSQVTIEGAVLAVLAAALFGLAGLYDRRAAANRHLAEQLAASRDELERQVEERTAHLAASNAELEQFAYVASHDLQEPLRSVSSFLQLLERRHGDKLDGEAREYIAFAVTAAKRMAALINDLLAFSRVGRQDGAPERCDSTALAQAAVSALSSAVARSGAEVAIDPLPPVWGKPSQLQSLFQNLIGNAVKYHDPARAPRVRVTARPEPGGMVAFSVADNGIGIDPEYHERIFGIFQRLHPIDRYEGTGIGLALCRKIVEGHGGAIRLDSTPGEGTVVHFTLKAAD